MRTELAIARGLANQYNEPRVFDWERAAQRIRETQAKVARAGLQDDWEWTGGTIWKNGKPVDAGDTYVFLASTWAIPELELDGQLEDCYKMQSETPGWGSDTYWPEEALNIINS